MTKRMLIDASHPEETRVVVLDGNRLEAFDVESANKMPLKGNIYLARVVRVEPSLQAAFVEYGGNRHGFLAFGEIHPDYYQLPVADRQRLIEMQQAEAREEQEREDAEEAAREIDTALNQALESATPVDEAPVDEAPTAEATARQAPASEATASEPQARGDEAGAEKPDTDESGPAMPMAIEVQRRSARIEPTGAASDQQAEATEDAAFEAERLENAQATADAVDEAADDRDADDRDDADRDDADRDDADRDDADRDDADRDDADRDAGDRDRSEHDESDRGETSADGSDQDEPTSNESAGTGSRQGRPSGDRHRNGRGRQDRGGRGGRSRDRGGERGERHQADRARQDDDVESVGNSEAPLPEQMGGSTEDEAREHRAAPRFLRHYKIQEVIKRRQIMLIQVVKEERGGKGAALTTYISLAGRFSVLMPNSPRGGGVSRKITSSGDRKRLREIIDEQGLPQGMSLIVRTAGAQRPKPEIKRDCEYLLRLWDGIRERTFASTAPALIYEEADLIKRSIRDVYGKDVEDVHVDGEQAYQDARDFMRMLMPTHVSKVKPVRDGVPLFARFGIDAQLDAMHSPNVQLKSGGYIVINQTEALVAIDVNSGRATRDRHIEDTALRTNLEAADEVARQLRLRDLAGLIVIDFIDMESSRNDGQVERRLKEALKQDRARIQVGRISHFGLMEMSRQRLRPSVVEHAYVACPHCQGRGLVRSVESSGLQVLRAIEEEGAKRRAAEIIVHVAMPVMLWLLNLKRERLGQIEQRYGMRVLVQPDDSLIPPALRIERTRAANPDAGPERQSALRMDFAPEPEMPESDMPELEMPESEMEEGSEVEEIEAEPVSMAEPDGPRAEGSGESAEALAEAGRRKRRRRRRGGRRDGAEGQSGDPSGDQGVDPVGDQALANGEDDGDDSDESNDAEPDTAQPVIASDAAEAHPEAESDDGAEDEASRRRRRGRRGGRRRREEGDTGTEAGSAAPLAPASRPQATSRQPQATPSRQQAASSQTLPPPSQPQAAPPMRRAPTPADPFAGHMDDIFMAMEAAEEAAERAATSRRAPGPAPAAAAPVEVTPLVEVAIMPMPIRPATTEAMSAEATPSTSAASTPVDATDGPVASEAALPELAMPDPAMPDSTMPDPTVPRVAEPDVGNSDLAAAGSPSLQADQPAAAMPSTPKPEAVAPPESSIAEPMAAPPVAPIVLGDGAVADLPRKRGWWRA